MHLPISPCPRPERRPGWLALAMLAAMVLAALALAGLAAPLPATAQACPPYCETPIVTPAWHLHMCDESYQEQLDDNHCMRGPGMVEFPSGTDKVHVIYCHKYADTVVVQIKDSGGGLQWVNHPDGETYTGDGCESLVFSHRNGIPSAGSPYYTSAYWPEGPFNGVGAGIEWFIGLFVAFDQDVYYGQGAEAYLTARDPAANEDPTQRDTLTVRVTSDSDPMGIDVVLREEALGFPLFKSERPVRFSTVASNPAQGVLKVNNRDTLTVSYCPRNCGSPYTDTAQWYQLNATITPTSLPTWSGPAPTATHTPEPGRRVEYLTLRPAPADVGYCPQISTNKGRPNHLGYPSLYTGMWTRGTNSHFGMLQFDLSALPEDAFIIDARLELVGRESKFTKPGSWAVKLLDRTMDAGWRDATYEDLRTTTVLAQIGPTLTDADVAVGRRNSFGFLHDQLAWLNDRLATTGKVSFRTDGPGGDENNLFAWHTGVDIYNREPEPPDPALGPALYLAYEVGPLPTATGSGAGTASATPPPSASPLTSATPGGPASSTPTSATPGPGTPSSTPRFPTIVVPTPTATMAPGSATATTAPGSATATTMPGSATSTAEVPSTAAPTATMGGPATSTPGPGTPSATSMSPATAVAYLHGRARHAVGDIPAAPPETPPATALPASTPSATATGPAVQRQVCVVAFDDRNGNGGREPEERFLAGVTVRLTHVRSGAFISRLTDGANDPDYCWNGLIDGDYSLATVTLPDGYHHTGAAEHRFTVPFPGLPARYSFGARLGPPPSPTPVASNTPAPTATRAPTGTATPTATATPSPTATPQPTVVGPAGELCLAVFHDRQGSGFPEPGHVLQADVRMTVRDETGTIVREVLSRSDEPVCVRLGVGVYYARATVVPGWVATSAEEQAVLVTLDGRQTVYFGQRRLREPGQVYLPFTLRPRPGTPEPGPAGR